VSDIQMGWGGRTVAGIAWSILFAASLPAATISMLVDNGGRVDWYKGAAHELIAYDAVVDPLTDNTEVYTINPDGSGQQCVTCDSPVRKGYVGSPAWYPDGEFMVLQVENNNSTHTRFNHMSWGFDNDLWLIKRDGTGSELIWATPAGNAALHPHFNASGAQLIFAERVKQSGSTQNQWTNWRIRIADVDITQPGTQKLSNVRTYQPSGTGFYETHQFLPDGRIVYSYTPGGKAYVDDIYTANADGTGAVNLLNSSLTWDEHGHFSPVDSQTFAFMSSRFDPNWKGGKSTSLTLRTELYRQILGTPQRVTFHNQKKTDKYIVSDFDWDATGTRIVYQRFSGGAQLWIVTF
jgi:hypothetical protein